MILLRLILIGLTSSNHLEGKFDPRVKPWRDMPRSVVLNSSAPGKKVFRSTKEERQAKRAARKEWIKQRFAAACSFVTLEDCVGDDSDPCKAEFDPLNDPK